MVIVKALIGFVNFLVSVLNKDTRISRLFDNTRR